jgi:hypothetical protein
VAFMMEFFCWWWGGTWRRKEGWMDGMLVELRCFCISLFWTPLGLCAYGAVVELLCPKRWNEVIDRTCCIPLLVLPYGVGLCMHMLVLDLAIEGCQFCHSLSGISCDISDNCSQPMYAGIEMIHMPHVPSNISIANLGVINSQFYRFLRLCRCKEFLVSQMVSLIVLLKIRGHTLKILLKRTRGLLIKEKL